MWRYAVPAVVLLVIAGFFYRGLHLNPRALDSALIGQKAPEFSLPGLRDPGIEVGTVDFAGRFALLNVWATWCQECFHEHAYLLELASDGVPIYGLNWKDDRAAALDFLSQLGDPYVATAFDDIGDVAIDYGVYGAPETFLIGPDRTILAKRIGVMTPEIWHSQFLPIIEAHRGGD